MSEERMTISLEEFLRYFIKKWKMVIAIVAVTVAIFAGGALLLGEEITVPHSEEYLWYEQELAWHESYLKDSILMNLNPTCIYERTLFLRNISDKELLRNYAVSSEIWNDLETDRSKTYISELIRWSENAETQTVEIKLRHATSQECLECAEYLKDKFLEMDPSLEIIIGAESISTDEELQAEHLRWYSRIDYVKSQLLNAQAGYTLKVNTAAAMITGALSGGLFSIVACLVSYLIYRKRENEDR